jgi:hypothetical protein
LPSLIPPIEKGQKTTTIRLGKRLLEKDLLVLKSRKADILVRVVDIEFRRFSELNRNDALKDGFKSLRELREALKRIYPNINKASTMTIVHFRTV